MYGKIETSLLSPKINATSLGNKRINNPMIKIDKETNQNMVDIILGNFLLFLYFGIKYATADEIPDWAKEDSIYITVIDKTNKPYSAGPRILARNTLDKYPKPADVIEAKKNHIAPFVIFLNSFMLSLN